MELGQGKVRGVLGKGSLSGSGWHWNRLPGQWSWPQAAKVQGALGQHSDIGLEFG